MKNKIILGLMLFAISFSSCKKMLDLSPEDYFGANNFWQNETQVTNFIAGLHTDFRASQFMFVRMGEMRGGGFADVERMPVSLNELPIIQQKLEENSAGIGSWGGFYSSILQINLFINKVEPVTFLPEAKKAYLLGQAYAMRAYYYFHLLRTYGGVPIRLTPDVALEKPDAVKLRLARSTEAEVLAAIKNDVNKSLEYFGTQASTDKAQWSPNAARMLKGEVYLWSAKVYGTTADLAEAKTALNAVTGYSLLSNFANVFKTKNNNEIIFTIRYGVPEAEMTSVSSFLYDQFNFNSQYYKDSSGTGELLNDPLVIAQPNSASGIQRYAYTYDLFKAYDITDQRRNATFYDFYKVDKTTTPVKVTVRNTVLSKFLGEINTNKRYFSDDWPVYREADRLLMLAEITNAEGGDPTQYIKPIRDRAYSNADPSAFVNGSKDQNEIAIFKERMKEFVFEGKRWYDIRRMKYGSDPLAFKSINHPYGVLNKATQAHMVLWPIPAAIWTDDPLVNQTPGYTTAKP